MSLAQELAGVNHNRITECVFSVFVSATLARGANLEEGENASKAIEPVINAWPEHSIDGIFLQWHTTWVWDIEFTDEFEAWSSLSISEQEDVAASVGLLEEHGPSLRFPHSSAIAQSRHSRMRELRIQHQGRPYRVLYAFDPVRAGILLIGGDKTGKDRWYDDYVPMADDLYDAHLKALRTEGKLS